MGEASRRKSLEQQMPPLDMQAVERVSKTLQKLTSAASTHHGYDCYLHTFFGRHLLANLGIKTNINSGFAAWRVGHGDGSVVAHVSHIKGHLPPGMQGFAYHAWLTYGPKIIDLTTYQLRQKAAELDALDGGHTDVGWCPEMLVADRETISTYGQVAQGGVGQFYYERNQAIEEKLASGFIYDPDDLKIAELILASPDIKVFGPNKIAGT